jgi:hypothetical protein
MSFQQFWGYVMWLENLRGIEHYSKDLDVDGKTILEWILRRRECVDWMDASGSG